MAAWNEILATQPLLKMWIDSLMTVDEMWDLAAIDRTQMPGDQGSVAVRLGKNASEKFWETQANGSATSESDMEVPLMGCAFVSRYEHWTLRI